MWEYIEESLLKHPNSKFISPMVDIEYKDVKKFVESKGKLLKGCIKKILNVLFYVSKRYMLRFLY